ncbi:hypothetical protein LUZ60_006913 [Juncus effusus]|nr:hypothetical protein LUZ60_006913 [Juncus effusus]
MSFSFSTPLFLLFTLLFSILLHSTSQTLLITLNATLSSPSRTFTLAFVSISTTSVSPEYYLSIYYTSLPSRTVIWTANRDSPSPVASAYLNSGHLSISGGPNGRTVWISDNSVPAGSARLLETGNLQLVSAEGEVVWESFSYPTDTWLPYMPVTRSSQLTAWKSISDPSSSVFSLRLRPPAYGEFELVFNSSVSYWSTGNWTGTKFAGVPEMTVPYIYQFKFEDPFGPNASFSYWVADEMAELVGYGSRVLTRFVLEPSGQLVQYTWLPQEGCWTAFWSRPINPCQVYGQCGPLSSCSSSSDGELICDCPKGLQPFDQIAWNSGDFSNGCSEIVKSNNGSCAIIESEFEEIGAVDFDGAMIERFDGIGKSSCEELCKSNCSCFGVNYDFDSYTCHNMYGNAYNLRNDTNSPILYLRVSKNNINYKSTRRKWNKALMASVICAPFVALILIVMIIVLIFRRKIIQLLRKNRDKTLYEKGHDGSFYNIKVFSFKELSIATKDFSQRIGHGSFGAVFRGELRDSTQVAVKRLERIGTGIGTGDREFRTEVRTIGTLHHVNLVRLLGFCSESTHRLLVYGFMPLGPLSAHLGSFNNVPPLSWPVRVKIATGTARALAYLHEGCIECIIHCDIKPDNILLDDDYTPKVSDFGLAKLIHRDLSRVVTSMRGTWGYVAPEWISGTSITAKADVYSYGMTLLEILGGRQNADVASSKGDKWVFYPAWAANRIVDGDVACVVDERVLKVGGFDLSEAERMGNVAVWCIQDEESARPTMRDVVKMLEGTIVVSKPSKPRLLQALVAQGESFRRESDSDCAEIGSVGFELDLECEQDVEGSEISEIRRASSY